MSYFEDYKCGCVSCIVKSKRELLGYCGVHGDDRREVWPVPPESETLYPVTLHTVQFRSKECS